MDSNESIIISRLREALELRKMSMSTLSKKSGIDKSIVSRYLHGKAVPKVAAIIKMSQTLDVDPAWLSGYDDAELPKEHISPIDLSKLTSENVTRLVAYYQALLDTQE